MNTKGFSIVVGEMSSSDLSEIENYLYYPEMKPRRIYNLGLLKLIAVVLIVLGLIGVYVSVRYAPVPIVKISDVENNILMNYATLYIEGYVVEPPRADVIGGKLRITIYVNDNSTPVNLAVYAYDPVATDILKQRKLPFFGDRVRLLVQLRVREDITYAYLQDVRGIWILSSPGAEGGEYVDSLKGLDEYKYVCVKGIISNPRNVSSGLLFDVSTKTGSVTVLVPNVLNYMYGDQASTVLGKLSIAGSPVDLCGLVYYYRGTSPEILVRRLEDIRLPLETGEVSTISFTDLLSNTTLYEGKTIKTRALFMRVECEAFSDPCALRFASPESTNLSIQLMFPRNLMSSVVNPWTYGSGTTYELTLLVVNSTYIQVVGANPVDVKSPVETTSVAQVLSLERGTIVILRNVRVTQFRETSGGSWQVTVSDGSSSIMVFVPSTIARQMTIAKPLSGQVISVAGYRHVYGSTDEIVVYSVDGIVIGPGAAPTPTTPPPTPGFIEIDIKDVKDYIGENVSFTGYLYAIRYDSASRIYYVEFRSLDEQVAVNVSMGRADLISLLDPAIVGWKSLVLIKGTVESNTTVKYIEGRVVNREEPLTVNVTEALNQPIGRPLKIPRARVTSAQTVGSNWKIYVTDESGGTIAVFIPASTVSDLGIELPKEGAIVVVAGYRDVYRGEQEIVVVSKNGFVVQG